MGRVRERSHQSGDVDGRQDSHDPGVVRTIASVEKGRDEPANVRPMLKEDADPES